MKLLVVVELIWYVLLFACFISLRREDEISQHEMSSQWKIDYIFSVLSDLLTNHSFYLLFFWYTSIARHSNNEFCLLNNKFSSDFGDIFTERVGNFCRVVSSFIDRSSRCLSLHPYSLQRRCSQTTFHNKKVISCLPHHPNTFHFSHHKHPLNIFQKLSLENKLRFIELRICIQKRHTHTRTVRRKERVKKRA